MNHKEAFSLMWYGCECGHRERMWNSRDGVTPFMTLCPSCDQPNMQHIWWNRDECAPDHKLAIGQRVWVSMTKERAIAIANARLDQAVASGRLTGAEASERHAALVADIFNDGLAPALVVWGYSELAKVRV